MSKVYLLPADAVVANPGAAVSTLFGRAGLADCFEAQDLVAVKLHVGERGCSTYVSPVITAALVRCLEAAQTRPFLTDTAVLYKSPRDNGVDHARVAAEHGFTLEAVGAPFIPADGLTGSEEIEVRVDGRHFATVAIATAVMHARSMLVLSHATGHLGTGLGAALKNLGMGCSSKKAKLRQHCGQFPRIDPETCNACGNCAEWCPAEAIAVAEHARIDEETCLGCGECVATCLEGAVKFDWAIQGQQLQERIVEHAAAIVRAKRDRLAFVTSVMNVTKDCDCLNREQEPLCADIGLLASRDPVAIDHAVLQLIAEREGRSLESMSYPDRDGAVQVGYAEQLGLGESEVELEVVEA